MSLVFDCGSDEPHETHEPHLGDNKTCSGNSSIIISGWGGVGRGKMVEGWWGLP